MFRHRGLRAGLTISLRVRLCIIGTERGLERKAQRASERKRDGQRVFECQTKRETDTEIEQGACLDYASTRSASSQSFRATSANPTVPGRNLLVVVHWHTRQVADAMVQLGEPQSIQETHPRIRELGSVCLKEYMQRRGPNSPASSGLPSIGPEHPKAQAPPKPKEQRAFTALQACLGAGPKLFGGLQRKAGSLLDLILSSS